MDNKEENKDLAVFSSFFAQYMTKHGCKLVNLKPDKYKTNFFVFYFENTPESNEMLNMLIENKKEYKDSINAKYITK